jgi:3-phosphoshikimate 1-carboxyvinyltransferase
VVLQIFLWLLPSQGKSLLRDYIINLFRADRRIIEVLKLFGADVNAHENVVHVRKNKSLPFNFDATHCPDIFPPLAVLAAAARGTSKIEGIERLLHKESNRLESVKEMLISLGSAVDISGNSMLIHGTGKLTGGTVNSHHDHRIVMASGCGSMYC